MRLLVFVLFVFAITFGFGQSDVGMQLFHIDLKEQSYTPKKKFLEIKKTPGNIFFRPFLYSGASLLFVYQRVLSPQIGADCTYAISCSEYTKRSISRFGIVKGTLMGLSQLQSCLPSNTNDHSQFLIDQNNKIHRLDE